MKSFKCDYDETPILLLVRHEAHLMLSPEYQIPLLRVEIKLWQKLRRGPGVVCGN